MHQTSVVMFSLCTNRACNICTYVCTYAELKHMCDNPYNNFHFARTYIYKYMFLHVTTMVNLYDINIVQKRWVNLKWPEVQIGLEVPRAQRLH